MQTALIYWLFGRLETNTIWSLYMVITNPATVAATYLQCDCACPVLGKQLLFLVDEVPTHLGKEFEFF